MWYCAYLSRNPFGRLLSQNGRYKEHQSKYRKGDAYDNTYRLGKQHQTHGNTRISGCEASIKSMILFEKSIYVKFGNDGCAIVCYNIRAFGGNRNEEKDNSGACRNRPYLCGRASDSDT